MYLYSTKRPLSAREETAQYCKVFRLGVINFRNLFIFCSLLFICIYFHFLLFVHYYLSFSLFIFYSFLFIAIFIIYFYLLFIDCFFFIYDWLNALSVHGADVIKSGLKPHFGK